MIKRIHLLTIVCFTFVYANYDNIIDLMPNRVYRLHWKLIENSQSIQFKVEAKSRGYFALGVSKSGGMNNADIVSGYVHLNGSAILHMNTLEYTALFNTDQIIFVSKATGHQKRLKIDRYSTGQKMPELVSKSNWQLINGIRNETHLSFEFKRKCAIEDANYDVAISKGLTNIIYAIGKSDPKDRLKIKYHGPKSRGQKEMEFLK